MKKWINIFVIAAILSTFFTSCDKDEDRVVLDYAKSSDIGLNKNGKIVSADTLVSLETNLTDTACVLTWDRSDFGTGIVPTYSLQFGVKNKDFQTSVLEVMGDSVFRKAYTYGELNDIALGLGLAANKAGDIQVRVKAEPIVLGSPSPYNKVASYSLSPVNLNITTWSSGPAPEPTMREPLHIIGAILGSKAWSNANYEYVMFRNNNDALDVYTTTCKVDGFKFISQKDLGTWNNLYGSSVPGQLSQSGGDIKDIKTAGYYTITADVENLTYSIVAYDASAAKTYTKISLIGAAVGGWDAANDVMMAQTDYDPHIWIVDNVALKKDEIKFRVDQDWAMAWGGSSFPYGIGDSAGGGANIKVAEEGTYFVKFNDITGHYVFYKK